MEVGEELIDNLEFEAGVDEDIGFTLEVRVVGTVLIVMIYVFCTFVRTNVQLFLRERLENVRVFLGDVFQSAGDSGANCCD